MRICSSPTTCGDPARERHGGGDVPGESDGGGAGGGAVPRAAAPVHPLAAVGRPDAGDVRRNGSSCRGRSLPIAPPPGAASIPLLHGEEGMRGGLPAPARDRPRRLRRLPLRVKGFVQASSQAERLAIREQAPRGTTCRGGTFLPGGTYVVETRDEGEACPPAILRDLRRSCDAPRASEGSAGSRGRISTRERPSGGTRGRRRRR